MVHISQSRLAGRLVGLFMLMVLWAGFAPSAQATHFRYGNINWTPAASDPSGRTIQFTINLGYRITYFASSVSVGQVLNDGNSFFYGDGGSAPFSFTVTSVNTANDFFYATATLTHTYATNGAFNAYFSSCCRISTLQNNDDESFYVGTTVTTGNNNRSPVATLSPIVNLAAGQATATFQVPTSDPDGDAITYALATSSDLGGISFVQPSGLSVSSTGQVTFNTSSASNGQLYSVVIKLTDARGAVTFLDFIIQISGSGNPPTFVYGPTPANGSTINGTVGTPISFAVQATDSDPGDNVTITGSGIPLGATLTPALPVSGTPTVSTSFSFTPSSNGTFVIVFTATDASGGQVQTSVTIQVGGTPPPPPGSFTMVAPTYNCATGAFTYNTINGDGTPITFFAIGINSPTTAPGPNYTDALDGELITNIQAQNPSVQPLTLYATQSGVTVTYVWDPLVACGGTPPPPPSTTTACGSPTATIGQPLALAAPSYDCATGAIRFNTTGGNGTTIEFMAIGITGWTANCTDNLDPGNTDNNTYTIMARQSGNMVSLSWTRPCASLRVAREAGSGLNISVLGNPTSAERIEFEVRGAEGKAVRLQVIESNGRSVSDLQIEQAGAVERRSLSLGRASGLYLLRATTPSEAKTVKVVKQ